MVVHSAYGEIDLVIEARFEAAMAHACEQHPRLLLKLSAVTFISNRGISTLFDHCPSLAAVIVGEHTLIARALHYAGFGDQAPIVHR